MDWQPIETAPKDGTLIDLWCRRIPDGGEPSYRRYINCKWGAPYNQLTQRDDPEQWLGVSDLFATVEPTHWMPPPEPPQ